MRIGIIGAGFTGLSAAYRLAKNGHEVTVFEAEGQPGGLALGYKEPGWKWPLEKHYHHLFASDNSILRLAGEVGHQIIFKRPISSTYIRGKIYQLDSPLTLLGFSELSPIDRFWTGVIILYLKVTPFWKPLERVTAEKYLSRAMGEEPWQILWQPLLIKKFGRFAAKIPASWFWARIKKRSTNLGYPIGGFESLAQAIEKKSQRLGAEFLYKTPVKKIEKTPAGFKVDTYTGTYQFDRVICTLPTPQFFKIAEGLSASYRRKYKNLAGLGSVNLILSLNRKFLPDSIYWLNINDTEFPFLALVEHTNFVPKKFYSGEKLLYIANYLDAGHEYFSKNANELLDKFSPYLHKVNPDFKKSWVKKASVFKAPFTQPIIPLNYSKLIPPMVTPIKGLYLANIQQVYPWDRGTNYAVELGEKAANAATNNLRPLHS